MRDTVLDWFTGRDTFFLLGAGCSHCAGKPLIAQLTEMVISDLKGSAEAVYKQLKHPSGRKANIEDLMNHLIRRQDLLSSLSEAEQLGDLSREQVEKVLRDIRRSVVKFIGLDWTASSHHVRFLNRIRQRQVGEVRDIFTLNYDTLIEASLDQLRIPYTDGFRGSAKGWFDASALDERPADQSSFRVQKLHGSVTWRRETTEHVTRYIGIEANSEAVLVYPSEQKYVQTQFGVYETLLGRFRDRMRTYRPNNTLITLGYSFNDEHINEAIFDAICANRSTLTLFAFVGPEGQSAATEVQKDLFQKISERCGARFNVFVGNNYAKTTSMEDGQAKEVLSAELWKFENVVEFVAGAAT